MRAVLDTNVFVAAGFRPQSASAALLAAARRGDLVLVWNEATRSETRHIVGRIPPLSWERIAPLFREGDRYSGETRPDDFDLVEDPDDRKFAALADAAGVCLVTSDSDLLDIVGLYDVEILTPGEANRRL